MNSVITFFTENAATWGYLLIFAITFLETSAFLGLVVPGESIVLISGLLASRRVFDPVGVAAVASLGAMFGDSVGFFLGIRFGRDFLVRHGRLFFVREEHVDSAEAYFERHGGKTVFLGRFIGFLRSFAPFIAGVSRMPYTRFLAYDVAGAVLWATGFTLLGYFFGESWKLIEESIGRGGLLLLGVLALGILAYLLVRHSQRIGVVTQKLIPKTLALPKIVAGLFALTAAGLFSWIAEDVARHGSRPFDVSVMRLAHGLSSPALDRLMLAVTFLGSLYFLTPIALLIGAALWRARRRREATAVVGATLTAEALVLALGYIFRRPRPDLFEPLVRVFTYSFPSGHAALSLAVYGIIAYLILIHARRTTGVLATVLLAALTLLIGASRVYLGVHWPTDVLAGYMVSLLVLTGWIYWLKEGERRRKARHGGIEPNT